jgi:hypothetical protein
VFRTENVGIPLITDIPNVLRLHTKPRRSSIEEQAIGYSRKIFGRHYDE